MKLNLLPQKVSQGQHLRVATIIGVFILVAAVVASFLMVGAETKSFNDAKGRVADEEKPYADAYATSMYTDDVVAQAADVIRDANLAQAMIRHNDAYPKLYEDLRPYIPPFFRITSESAAPQDATTSTITLTGTLSTYQQYADVVLALMRFPDAVSISRSGFNLDDPIVPNLTETDNVGFIRKPDQQPIPQNQLERLTAEESQVQPTGYQGLNNFGGDPNLTRGAAPKESMITIVISVKRDLQTPEPTSTLSTGGGAAASTLTGGFGPQGGPPMGGSGGGPNRMGGGFGTQGAPGADAAAGGSGPKRGPSKASDGD